MGLNLPRIEALDLRPLAEPLPTEAEWDWPAAPAVSAAVWIEEYPLYHQIRVAADQPHLLDRPFCPPDAIIVMRSGDNLSVGQNDG